MRKRYLFLMSLVAFFSIFFVGMQSQNVHAASQYGIARKYTTPKATRGTWYYRETDKFSSDKKTIHTLKITAHTADKNKLYVPSQKFFKKNVYNVSSKKRNAFIKKVMKKNIYAAYNFKKGFNVNNWVNLAGDGVYYIPVTRTVKGKKVKALKIATGADQHASAYAFKTKALAKVAQ
ncbi:hypothetical protein [Lactobacillus amylovorus]|uniref:hypothetical protein n=1 Tax=Lactobacillus amylovorus TaxID=1604 RepID=UPI0022439312|nr:hypothetical protein [Lactobacillus amylovorus]